jgi:hypothetical protein
MKETHVRADQGLGVRAVWFACAARPPVAWLRKDAMESTKMAGAPLAACEREWLGVMPHDRGFCVSLVAVPPRQPSRSGKRVCNAFLTAKGHSARSTRMTNKIVER